MPKIPLPVLPGHTVCYLAGPWISLKNDLILHPNYTRVQLRPNVNPGLARAHQAAAFPSLPAGLRVPPRENYLAHGGMLQVDDSHIRDLLLRAEDCLEDDRALGKLAPSPGGGAV